MPLSDQVVTCKSVSLAQGEKLSEIVIYSDDKVINQVLVLAAGKIHTLGKSSEGTKKSKTIKFNE